MLAVGDHAPQFELTAIDGERYSLQDKLTLAIFFKTSCPTCQYGWPFYERLCGAYKAAGLEVCGISQHDREKTGSYAAKYEANFPHLVDEQLSVSRQYGPEFVPTGFLISAEQEIVHTFVSWNSAELGKLSRTIASRLHVPPQELFKPNENVVPFKPG